MWFFYVKCKQIFVLNKNLFHQFESIIFNDYYIISKKQFTEEQIKQQISINSNCKCLL